LLAVSVAEWSQDWLVRFSILATPTRLSANMAQRFLIWIIFVTTVFVSGWPGALLAADVVPDARREELRDKIRDCLAHYYRRPEDAARRTPWGLMHWALAYGVDAEVTVRGHRRNAIGWLCWNGSCRGRRLLRLYEGRLEVKLGTGLQGHRGQFLAMLAQCRVRPEYTLKVNDHEFTVADVIEFEKQECVRGNDLSFKLLGLSHYLDSESTWEAKDGKSWSILRLIEEELAQPVVYDSACGGTHRLMGLSYAVRRRSAQGHPFKGNWQSAQTYVRDFQEYAFEFQNPDGSFSTNWFQARGAEQNISRRMQTTGHILEWLIFSLPPEALSQPRMTRSVEYLTKLLLDNRNEQWEIGPKGHTLGRAKVGISW
jgi:hypothetical protein